VPYTLPSEEEAQKVREGAPEAIPAPADGGQGEEESRAPEVAPAVPEAQEEGTRPGYRVQVFATTDPALAEARAGEMRQLFEEQVYVEFEGELFKVRVGDCTNREEAANLRRRALGLGLEGAFIVDARVREP
jgi:cell division septation protein DedD